MIADELTRVGLELVEDLDGAGMSERYARTGPHALEPPVSMHIVSAHVRPETGAGKGR
jgi:hypothetical protein